MANALRGESAVLGYKLRPTFEALCQAEAELGPLFALVERAAAGGLTLSETAALLWWCVDPGPVPGASGGRPERAAFGEALLAGGLAKATPAVRDVLRQVLAGQG